MSAVYLAGPYAARDRLNAFAADLRSMLVEVTASWLDETHDITPGTVDAATDLPDADVAKHASDDLNDIGNADLLVLITAAVAGVPNATSGGRHVETGFALAMPIPVLVVGEPENVFHRLGADQGVFIAKDWRDALRKIATHEGGLIGRRLTWAEALA